MLARVAAGVLAFGVGAVGVHAVGALATAPPPAPVVRLTPAQAAAADAVPAHPGVIPVLDAGRIAEQSTTAEPAMSPRAFALTVATLVRAGYTFVTPEDAADTGVRAVVLVVDAAPATMAVADSVLERFDARAVAVPRPDRFGRPTPAPAPAAAPATDQAGRQRWSLAASLPAAGDGSMPLLRLPTDITPEGVTHLLRNAVPAPVRLDSPGWASPGADCIPGESRVHIAARTGAADPVCHPTLNADTWRDYRLIADVTPLRGSAVITLRDSAPASATRHGRIEVRVNNTQVTVVETGDGSPGIPDRMLGRLPLGPAPDGGGRRVEAGVEGDRLTVSVDGAPVRTAAVSDTTNASGGVGFGAQGQAAEAEFTILGIAGR